MPLAVRTAKTDGSRQGRVLGRADLLDGIPILTPGFGLPRLEKTEIGLIVRVNAGHELDVRAILAFLIFVRQVPIPRITELVIAPRPLFFPGRNVMVGIMNNAGLR